MSKNLLIAASLLAYSFLSSHLVAKVSDLQQATRSTASTVCYAQTGGKYAAVVSQNFADYTSDTSQAADHFTLTSSCTVKRVTVEGKYYNGYGPAASVAITIYDDDGRLPGTIVPGGNEPSNRYSDPTQSGDLSIKLKHPISLAPGTYWISVAVNMAYDAGGEWGWWTTPVKVGPWAVWRNPKNGFSTGCTNYTNIRKCLGDVESSLIFTVIS